jgi:diacylglycerol kinase family enzyme
MADRHYIMSISVGVSAATMAATERAQKRRIGKVAYFLQGLGELRRARRSHITLEIDDRRVRARGSEIVVANTGLVGFREVRLSPDILPDDGRLHVCVVQAATLGGYLKLLGSALGGDAARLPEMNCFPGDREVRIDAERPLPVQGDGESVGETPVSVGIDPGSLRVLVRGARPKA